MDHYRIYLLNAIGRIVAGRDAMCVDDQAARAAASVVLNAGQEAEVWNGSRRVGRVGVGAGGCLPPGRLRVVVANDVTGGTRSAQPGTRFD